MVKSMNKLKKFKVFYFLDGDHQGIDETRRKWALIMANNEDEAEKLFKLAYSKDLSDYKIFFLRDLKYSIFRTTIVRISMN